VRIFADLAVASVSSVVIADLEGIDMAVADRRTKTEGGRKVFVSGRIERDPSLRAAALRIHGTACCICGFDYETVYGEWGSGFAEVHHLIMLGGAESSERLTDPEHDLAVVCANCHRMIHRRRDTVLTLDDLRHRLNCHGISLWASRLSIPKGLFKEAGES
jgi:predicted HNH restriction endonuclease